MILDDSLLTSVNEWLSAHQKTMVDDLLALVNLPSYSRDKAGCDRVADWISHWLARLPGQVTRIPETEVGDQLIYTSPAALSGQKAWMLMGHMDTVFPPESPFQSATVLSDRIVGPGVVDMKGGLIVGLYTLAALDAMQLLDQIPLMFMLNSDEEIGSRYSIHTTRSLLDRVHAVFILEESGPSHEIAIARKGRMRLQFTVTGEAGHAAYVKENKASAILALARLIQELEALNNVWPEAVFNVGVIKGGVADNVVSEQAVATLGCRFPDMAAKADIVQRIDDIIAAEPNPRISIQYTIPSAAPPMQPDETALALADHIVATAARLGQPVTTETRWGASDGNMISDLGTPVIDGLGPRGGNDHCEQEYIFPESLSERAVLLTASLLQIHGAGDMARPYK